MAGIEHPTPELPPALTQPGIIIRASVNIGQQDVLQFETFCDRDEVESEINHRCEVMIRVAARQRAKYLLPSYERQREDDEHKTNENKARLAELDARLKAMDEARAEKVEALRKEMGDAVARARDEHYASGRRGEFRPKPATTSNLQTQIDQVFEAGQKEHAEAAIERSRLDNEIKEGTRLLFKWDVLIQEQREALALAANDG